MREIAAFEVAGVKINSMRVADIIDVLDDWTSSGHRNYVVLTGAHGVVEMQIDDQLRLINNAAGLITPDGMPIVWLGKLAGHRAIEKCSAVGIMTAVFAAGLRRGWKHYLYGGKDGVAVELAIRLRARHPGIQIVGTHCPPFRALTEHEIEDVAGEINQSDAHIVWCGLGCPKQERWMATFRKRLHASALIGVGAGFDFLSGRARLAPRWIQQSGLEWLFRLASEPKRLWPRYSRVVPLFLYYVTADGLRLRRRMQPRPRD